ncbi:MAG: hypothetical protein U9N49_06080 [Campylobacterota bacterium]|nr:hypothetical protein [Campylobacterota bacterium]
MVRYIVAVSLLASSIYAQNGEQNFVNDASKTILMGSQKSFESGAHDLKANENMKTLFVNFRYNFDSSSDINFYLGGAAGLSKLENDKPFLGELGDRVVIDALNVELSGGVRYKISNESYISAGGGVTYSQLNPKFEITSALALSNQTLIDTLYNSGGKLDAYTYQANIKYDYETNIKGYEPYATAFLGYYYTDIDGIEETSSSTLAHIKAGIYSPELIKLYNLPFKVELYAQESFIMGDLEENMDTSNFSTIGMALHLYTNTIVPLVDNVYFDVNYVTGDNIEGLHLGLSASF